MPPPQFFPLPTWQNGAYLPGSNMEAPDEPNSRDSPQSQAAEAIDVSLLEDSLRLTPWQRLQENERALALVRMLEAAQVPTNGTSESVA